MRLLCRYNCGEDFGTPGARGSHERWRHGGAHASGSTSASSSRSRVLGDRFDTERPRGFSAVHAKASDKWPGRP